MTEGGKSVLERPDRFRSDSTRSENALSTCSPDTPNMGNSLKERTDRLRSKTSLLNVAVEWKRLHSEAGSGRRFQEKA